VGDSGRERVLLYRNENSIVANCRLTFQGAKRVRASGGNRVNLNQAQKKY